MNTEEARSRRMLWWSVPAWAVCTVAVAVLDSGTLTWDDFGYLLVQGALITTGSLILVNRPGHLVGRFSVAAGASFTTAIVLSTIFDAFGQGPESAIGAVFVAVATLWVVLATWSLVYFPDSRLPSRRWRWVTGFFWVTLVVAFLAPLINGGWGGDPKGGPQPPWHESFEPWGDRVSDAFFMLSNLGIIIAVASLVVRYRRGRAEERQQLKLVVWAVLLVGTWTMFDAALFGLSTTSGWRSVLGALSITLVPLAIALAIVRYRLYDVDRIISRTVSYILVVALLAVVFVAGVVWIPQALGLDGSSLLVAGSTLAVAALFNPIRQRLQRVVDRRFNRQRYDVETVVERFTSGLRAEQDLDEVASGLGAVIDTTLRPAQIGVWLDRSG